MKNKKFMLGIIFTIICNFIFLLVILRGMMSISNYKLPNEITKDEFENIIKDANCSLVSVEQKDTQYDIYLSTDNDCPYLISYVYSKEEDLRNLFNNLAYDALYNNTNITGKTNIQISSEYYNYSTSGDYYKSVILNNNTLLYSSVKKEYRNYIINLFDEYRYNFVNLIEFEKNNCYAIGFLLLIIIVSLCFIENKIRNKWWIGLIPLYNIWCLSDDVLSNHWYSLLLFIPIVNIIFICILICNICKSFGKKGYFKLLSILFPSIMLPIVAFDNSKYIKIYK